MFADPSCETLWAPSSRRGWTTLVSFALQTLGVGVLLLLPLIYNEAIPAIKLTSLLTAPLPPPGPAPAPTQPRGPHTQTNMNGTQVVMPPTFPDHVAILHDAPCRSR